MAGTVSVLYIRPVLNTCVSSVLKSKWRCLACRLRRLLDATQGSWYSEADKHRKGQGSLAHAEPGSQPQEKMPVFHAG